MSGPPRLVVHEAPARVLRVAARTVVAAAAQWQVRPAAGERVVVQAPAPTVASAPPPRVLVPGAPAVVVVGVPGPAGPAGGGGDAAYTHVQAAPAATWLIAHGLGKYPSVTLVDSTGRQFLASVEYLDAQTVRVVCSAAQAGVAYCN